MKFLNNKSISYKFVFIVLVISAVNLVVSEVISYYMEKGRTQNSLIQNTILDAHLIGDYCVVPLEFEDKEAGKKILSNLHSKPSIKSAILFTYSKEIFAVYGDTSQFALSSGPLCNGREYCIVDDRILVKSEIVYDDTHYGTLFMESKTNLHEISRLRILFSIVMGVSMLLLALLLSSILKRYITGPVFKLIGFTRELINKTDYSMRIKKVYDDEVGQLYDEFNFLLNVIQDANSKLEEHQMNLESQVEERTLDLLKTNAQLVQAKNDAEKANMIKGEFLSNMSHELRTPLNGIMGYAQILKTMGDLDARQTEQVDIIHSSGKHLLSLINEILDYSKIEADKLKLSVAGFSLKNLIQHVMNIIRVRAEQKDLMLVYDKGDHVPDFVKGDELKVRQIIINILSNAVKYTNTGGVIMRINRVKYRSYNLKIEVEDTGIGIPENKIGKIFEPFTQVNEQVKFVEGTGLGLAITNKLIMLMNGKLEVESEEGVGSVFTVYLNLPEAEEVKAELPDKASVKGYKGDKITILAVDDNITNLSVLVSLLVPVGFNVVTAHNGLQAIEEFKTHKPALVLMDFVMPEMTGFEAIKVIRQLDAGNKAKFIGISASIINQGDRKEFVSICDAEVNKPIDVDELFSTIRDLLDIDWISDEKGIDKVVQREMVSGEELIPEVKILNDIAELAETGDFAAIGELLNGLVNENQGYFQFTKRIKEFSNNYDSDKLVRFINSLK